MALHITKLGTQGTKAPVPNDDAFAWSVTVQAVAPAPPQPDDATVV